MGFVYLMPCNIPIKAQICFYVHNLSFISLFTFYTGTELTLILYVCIHMRCTPKCCILDNDE